MTEEGEVHIIKVNFCVNALIDLTFYQARNLLFENNRNSKSHCNKYKQGNACNFQDFLEDPHKWFSKVWPKLRIVNHNEKVNLLSDHSAVIRVPGTVSS